MAEAKFVQTQKLYIIYKFTSIDPFCFSSFPDLYSVCMSFLLVLITHVCQNVNCTLKIKTAILGYIHVNTYLALETFLQQSKLHTSSSMQS